MRSDARCCDILRERVADGVTVRALYDPVGSFSMLTRGYVHALRAAGVEVHPYSPIWRLHTISYRNHRKLVIIDSEIGYTGGLNLTSKHLTGPAGILRLARHARARHRRRRGDAAVDVRAAVVQHHRRAAGRQCPRTRSDAGPARCRSQVVNSGPTRATASSASSTWP